ncbi:MAG: gliding motility-associated C-terminal domain-containing protein [Bacteroidota bacterium]
MRILFLLILLLIGSLTANAQLVNNGEVISVLDGAVITVNGNINNNAFGEIVNGGLFIVSGNWNNVSTYRASDGTVRFASDTRQTITHNGNAFFNIQFAGDGEKVLQDEMRVSNEISSESSLINTRDPNATLIIGSAAQMSGFSSTSYVDGYLYHEGLGSKNFPVGTAANYLPVTLEDIQGQDPIVGIGAIEPNPNTETAETLQEVSANRYWDLDVFAGEFNGSLVTLPIVDDDATFLETGEVVIGRSAGLSEPYINLGQSQQTNLSVTSRDLAITGSLVTIAVVGEESFFVPSALFTNAPDENDQVIKVYSEELLPDNFSFIVYDKWGQVIFESNDLDTMQETGWRGVNSSGQLVKMDVYTYLIRGTFQSGKDFENTGTITMLR